VADPISWLVLEPGHKVVTADGEEVGKVEEVLGDTVADIFDGLTVGTGLLGKPRYVPAELVVSIDTEAVHLTISKAEADRLEEYTPPRAVERDLD
jgi:hypothetical protein